MPDVTLASVIALVCLAAVFDYSNGFHDAANSIATVVSTRVLSPRFAVVWAAFFNFIAFAVFRTHVANTVGTIIDPNVVSEAVVFGGLVGAIAWNLTTWWLGLPTSSSHALIGGVVGAGMAKAGWSVVNAPSFEKTVIFIVVSPLLGMFFAFVLMLGLMWLFKGSTPRKVEHLFRRLQLLSAPATSTSAPAASCRCPSGWSCWPTARSRWARCPAAGGSSRPSGRRSPRSSRSAASPRRRQRPPRCTWRPSSASRSRPPTPSRGRSSEPARRAGCQRSAGESPGGSSGRG